MSSFWASFSLPAMAASSVMAWIVARLNYQTGIDCFHCQDGHHCWQVRCTFETACEPDSEPCCYRFTCLWRLTWSVFAGGQGAQTSYHLGYCLHGSLPKVVQERLASTRLPDFHFVLMSGIVTPSRKEWERLVSAMKGFAFYGPSYRCRCRFSEFGRSIDCYNIK